MVSLNGLKNDIVMTGKRESGWAVCLEGEEFVGIENGNFFKRYFKNSSFLDEEHISCGYISSVVWFTKKKNNIYFPRRSVQNTKPNKIALSHDFFQCPLQMMATKANPVLPQYQSHATSSRWQISTRGHFHGTKALRQGSRAVPERGWK